MRKRRLTGPRSRLSAFEERRVKLLLKDAVVEVLEERHDLLREALQERLEGMCLFRAVQEGEKSPLTSRKKIFRRH